MNTKELEERREHLHAHLTAVEKREVNAVIIISFSLLAGLFFIGLLAFFHGSIPNTLQKSIVSEASNKKVNTTKQQSSVADDTITITPTVTVTVTATPSPSLTSTKLITPTVIKTPTPTAVKVVTSTVAPEEFSIKIIQSAGTENPGDNATESIETVAGASCTIEVVYKTTISKAEGLTAEAAGSDGTVSWTWKVGTNTTPGSWPIYMSCTLDGISKQIQDSVNVQ